VLAGNLQRNLCFLQPSDPNMTDESMAKCLLQAPKNSIIVIEDIDALFGKDRQTTQKTTPLTFSGLLNALDGVANPDGQVFVLTTNFVDKLDEALIRAGRVDVRVKFNYASPAQVEAMFLHFYPSAKREAKVFVEKISEIFKLTDEEEITGSVEVADKKGGNEDGEQKKKMISMASLQQLFIQCRTCTAEETLRSVVPDAFAC